MYKDETEIGDYLVANTGYTIQVIPEEEVLETIEIWKKLKEINQNY